MGGGGAAKVSLMSAVLCTNVPGRVMVTIGEELRAASRVTACEMRGVSPSNMSYYLNLSKLATQELRSAGEQLT
jgi:hypothetical protein